MWPLEDGVEARFRPVFKKPNFARSGPLGLVST
jgi:hypothetical protein